VRQYSIYYGVSSHASLFYTEIVQITGLWSTLDSAVKILNSIYSSR